MTVKRIRSHSAEEYTQALINLNPTGAAYLFDGVGEKEKTMQFMADGFSRFDVSLTNLILIEMNPGKTTQLITEWEKDYNLPDPCITEPQSIEQRRKLLLAKVIQKPNLSIPFLESLAALLGITITIEQTDTLELTVSGPPTTVTEPFTVNSSVNDPLTLFGDELLECTISAAAMAGIRIIYTYPV